MLGPDRREETGPGMGLSGLCTGGASTQILYSALMADSRAQLHSLKATPYQV